VKVAINCLCLPFLLFALVTGAPTPAAAENDQGTTDHRFHGRDLTYLGAFMLPNQYELTYCRGVNAYYPDGDPGGPDDGYPGSLFGVGHDWTTPIYEVDFPAPVLSENRDELPVARLLQGPADVARPIIGSEYVKGLEYLPPQGSQTEGHLYFVFGEHYEYRRDPGHGWMSLDFSRPNLAGAWYVGRADQVNHINTNEYIFTIPQDWADANTPGMRLACGRYRKGQQAGGPALIAYGPWLGGDPPPPDTELPAVPLILYGFVDSPNVLENFCKADDWTGGAWLHSEDRSAVVFAGTKGSGRCWYGWQDGTTPDQCAQLPGGCEANGYGGAHRGYWAEVFTTVLLFYDTEDLARVARGELESWEVQPYEQADITPFMIQLPENYRIKVAGVAYAPEQGYLFVSEEKGGYEARPVIHVWKLDPAPPESQNNGGREGGAQAPPPSDSLQLAVSPNPFRGTTTVYLDGPALGTGSDPVMNRVALYDVTGKMVKDYGTVGATAVQLNAADVPTGTYFLRVMSGGRSYTKKVSLLR